MLIVGTAVGGLFAAFSFAISAFSIPMLLDERIDALTAMGTSMALVWNNLPVMLAWGAIVLALFVLGLATGLLGLIVVFPLLGHATWHAYRAMQMNRALELSDELLRPSAELPAIGQIAHARATKSCSPAAISATAFARPTCRCRRSIAAPASGRSRRRSARLPASRRARVNLSTKRVDVALATASDAAAVCRDA